MELCFIDHRLTVRGASVTVLICCPRLSTQVALSGSVAFARSDTGQLFSWGGRDKVWNSVDSIQDRGNKDVAPPVREQRADICRRNWGQTTS